jgi:hypothetical protein
MCQGQSSATCFTLEDPAPRYTARANASGSTNTTTTDDENDDYYDDYNDDNKT